VKYASPSYNWNVTKAITAGFVKTAVDTSKYLSTWLYLESKQLSMLALVAPAETLKRFC
jgi:hypothetical protein